MTNFSRTTLRELKKRYLNILKKCLLANLGLILLSTPSIAEPTTYTAEEIYEKLTNGQGVTVDGQIIDTPIQAGVFTGRLYFSRNADYPSNVTFSDGSIFKVGFHVSDSTTLNLGKSYFDGASLVNWGGKVNFSGDAIFENIKGFAVRNQVDTNGVMTLSFKKAEFYNNTLLNSGSSGVFHVYGVSTLSFDGDVIFGKYILDENGDFIFDDHGNLIVSSNKTNNVESSQGGAIRSQGNWHMTIDGQGIFIGNEAQAQTAYGGALFNGLVSYITFNNIAKFELNKAISTTGNSYGGAIFNTSSNSLTFNDFVSFGGYLKDKDGNLILDDEGGKISVGNMAISKETVDAEGNVIASGNAYGGAIGAGFDNAGVLNFKEVDFIANKVHSESAEAYGGAISTLIEPKNHTSHLIKISGPSLFQDNIAQGATKAYGGAIYNESGTKNNDGTIKTAGVTLSDVSFIGNKAESTTTDGEAKGGAIYNKGTMQFNGETLFENNIAKNGGAGAIDNIGLLKFNGITVFSENKAISGGALISARKTSKVTFNNQVEFKNNTASAGSGGAIYNKEFSEIDFNGKSVFSQNISKNGGAIYNEGRITFNQDFEFKNNMANIPNDISNAKTGTINFNHGLDKNGVALVGSLDGGIHNAGIINKTGAGTLILGDEMVNSGAGTFNQYIGKTIAHSEKFLAGTNNILGGVLETHGAKISYTASIGDETHTASLIHHSMATGNSDPTSLTTALKLSAGSTALFDSATNGVQANYELTEDMAGAGMVTFKDAHITLGQTNYNGAYVMGENVTLNMQDGEATDRVEFTNLTGSANLKIDANIVNGANGLELVTDQIATNQEATLKLNLTDVVLSENALDNGLSDSYTATVMAGGTLTYGSEKGLVATDIYSYEVSGANNQITIDAVKFNEGSDVMKSVAEFDGDAAFNMTIGGDSYEMQSDVVMTKNTKSIVGKDKETSTLTAKKITVNGATLNVENVSVSGENQLIDVASGTLNVTTAKVDNIKNAGEATLNTAEVSELENAGTLTANGSTIGALVNGNEAEVTGGELETATNKEKGMLSLSAGLRAGTVTNEGELTLDGVTVADLTNSATLKTNGSTVQKLVNEQESELTASTVEDLTNMGKMTAKDLTLKGALKGTGTATLSGKLVADDLFKSENKIISDGMEVSENIQKMELADLEIKAGTTLDIGTREVMAKDVKVGDKATLQVTLNDLDEFGTMKADKIEAGAEAGVHLVLGEKFEGGVFDVFKGTKGAGDLEVKHNNLYNVIEVEEGKYSFMTKDTEALQESLGATKEEVSVADAMTQGTSTNEAFNKMQSEMLIALQSLETDTVAKAKKALKAVGTSEQPSSQSIAASHFNELTRVISQMAMEKEAEFGQSGGEEAPRAKVYIKGLYDKTKSTMGDGFKARSQGAVLGVQSEVTDTLTLGVGYATSQTTAKEDLRRTEVDTNTGFISAHYQPNAWWVSGLATFSRGEYEEEKQILSSMGKASYNVDSWGAQVMTGYDIKLENTIITPEVGMRYLSVKQEGYTDTLGTTVSGTRSDYLTALVGMKGTWNMGAIRPIAGVTVGYDVISDDVSALNTLANGASYTVNGEALDRLSTSVTTGVEADLGERTTLKLEYSGTYRKEYVDHSGMIKFELRF